MAKPFDPSQEERDQMLAHVAYERDMMIGALKRLLSGEPRDSLESNALIESCAIHARSLRFFLITDKLSRTAGSPAEHDAYAKDYYKPETWNQHKPADTALLHSLNYLVGKFLAHPSYKRDAEPKPNVRFLKCVVDEIMEMLADFEDHADNDVDWARFAPNPLFQWP